MTLTHAVRDKIMQDAFTHLERNGVKESANLYLYEQPVETGQEVMVRGIEGIAVPQSTAYVFVDLAPQYNWAHPCAYRLYNATNGVFYREYASHLPPLQLFRQPKEFTAFHAPVAFGNTRRDRLYKPGRIPALTNALANAPGERYAVLFSGHSNHRHVNDLEFLYRTLIDVYGFQPANIYVLNFDGTAHCYETMGQPVGNWPGDNTPYRMVVNGPGTQAGFDNVLNTLATLIRPSDFLFIHTNNHGGGVGDGVTDYCMFVYDAQAHWVPYYVNDFTAKLQALPPFEVLMVMMEQCRSGGFIDPILNHSSAHWTHVTTAVQASDYSLGGYPFDAFAEDWIAGVTGHYAGGGALTQPIDANHDGRISAAEAFIYANAVHHAGDTPTFGERPAGYGSYIYLGQPAHDLFLRDNLQDHGREPLISGGISCSPDIVVYNQELLDPEAILATPAAQDSDTLGQPVEYGQDNYIYLRVQNRGTQATNGTAKVFWARPSTFPTPASWNLIDEIVIPAVGPGEFKVVGPIKWAHQAIPAQGHYCFVGLVNSGSDPAPDPGQIHSSADYYHFIQESNNATWKNFDVVDVFKNSVTSEDFHIQGWPHQRLSTDLVIDLTPLPGTVKVSLRILKRLSQGAQLENATLEAETELYQRFRLGAGRKVTFGHMNLKASDDCHATLEFTIPDTMQDGHYRYSVTQVVDGKSMGTVTRMLAVGDHPYMANRTTEEVHLIDCKWAGKMSRRNKVAYDDLDRAIKEGYNGCRFCLPELDTDR